MKFTLPGGLVRACILALAACITIPFATAQTKGPIVFQIMLENHNWIGTGGIYASPEAPYINDVLVPQAAVANNYFNPYGVHPSLPNYLWLEAGSRLGVYSDLLPSQFSTPTHAHLTHLLSSAGITWRNYAEDISGNVCPLTPEGSYDSSGERLYQPRHVGQVYFDDVTDYRNPKSTYCIEHIRPYSQLANDLKYGRVARYNIITPNVCHDGHDPCGGNTIHNIDTWLKDNMPMLLNSEQYKAGNVIIFIATDEAANGDGPIPFLALGRDVKHGYKNEIRYTHSSLLRSLEEFYHVSPLLGWAKYSDDLRDLFAVWP